MICPASDYRRSLALGASPGDAHHQFNSPPEACSDRSQPGGPLDSDVLVDIEQLRSKIKDGSSNEANITWAPTPQHSPAQKASTQHPSRFTLKPYLPAISHAPTYHSRRVTGSSSDGVQIEVSGTAARSSYGAHMSASGRPPFRPQSGNAPPQLAEVEPAACRSTSGKAPERGLALIVSTDDHTDRTLHMMSMSSSASLGAHSYRCSSGDAGPWRLDSAPTCATQHPPANSHLTTQRSSVPSMPTRLYPVALAAYPPSQAMASWNGQPDDHAPESVRVAGLSAPPHSYAQQNSEDLEAGNARASSARSSASWRWMPSQLQSLVIHMSSGAWPTSGRKQPHASSIRDSDAGGNLELGDCSSAPASLAYNPFWSREGADGTPANAAHAHSSQDHRPSRYDAAHSTPVPVQVEMEESGSLSAGAPTQPRLALVSDHSGHHHLAHGNASEDAFLQLCDSSIFTAAQHASAGSSEQTSAHDDSAADSLGMRTSLSQAPEARSHCVEAAHDPLGVCTVSVRTASLNAAAPIRTGNATAAVPQPVAHGSAYSLITTLARGPIPAVNAEHLQHGAAATRPMAQQPFLLPCSSSHDHTLPAPQTLGDASVILAVAAPAMPYGLHGGDTQPVIRQPSAALPPGAGRSSHGTAGSSYGRANAMLQTLFSSPAAAFCAGAAASPRGSIRTAARHSAGGVPEAGHRSMPNAGLPASARTQRASHSGCSMPELHPKKTLAAPGSASPGMPPFFKGSTMLGATLGAPATMPSLPQRRRSAAAHAGARQLSCMPEPIARHISRRTSKQGQRGVSPRASEHPARSHASFSGVPSPSKMHAAGAVKRYSDAGYASSGISAMPSVPASMPGASAHGAPGGRLSRVGGRHQQVSETGSGPAEDAICAYWPEPAGEFLRE